MVALGWVVQFLLETADTFFPEVLVSTLEIPWILRVCGILTQGSFAVICILLLRRECYCCVFQGRRVIYCVLYDCSLVGLGSVV